MSFFKKWCLLNLILFTGWMLTAEDMNSSPWVGWRKGYEFYDQAGVLKGKAQYTQAIESYTRSRECFLKVQRNFPDWNKAVIAGRIRLCDDEINSLRKLINKPARITPEPRKYEAEPPAPPPAERPVRRTSRRQRSEFDDYDRPRSSGTGGSGSRLYIEMQSELDQYRNRLRNALMEIDNLQVKLQQADRRQQDVDGLLRDYRTLQEKYALLELQYKNALQQAAQPTEERRKYEARLLEMQKNNDDISRARRQLEIEVRLQADEYAAARREILVLKDAAKRQQNVVKRLERELELAKVQAAPAVSREQSDRIADLEKTMAEKDQRIARLMKLLEDKTPGPGGAANAEMEKKLAALQEELSALKKANSSENELHRRNSDLTVKLDDTRKQLASAQEALKLQQQRFRGLESDNQKLTDAAKVSKTELDAFRRRSAELEAEVKTLTERYNTLDKRHQDRLAADALNTAALTKARKDADAKLTELQRQYREVSGKFEQQTKDLAAANALIKSSRATVIDLKTRLLSTEIELRKMKEVKTAYDELQRKFDLMKQASNSDILTALNRIPGLEESLRRYEAENSSLHKELNSLKTRLNQQSAPGSATAAAVRTLELEKLETLLSDARAAEARSNLEIAIWGYRQVLARDKDNLEACTKLGNIYLKRGSFDDAWTLLAEAVKQKPQDARIVNAAARALIGKREYKQALDMLNKFKAARGGRADVELLSTEALAWSRSGKAPEAEKTFKAVLKLAPNNGEAAYELALMLSADPARRKEAGEFYLRAKENGIGVDSYLEDILRSVTNQDQETVGFLQQNVVDALKSGDWSSAQWYLNELGKLSKDNPRSRILQAMLYCLTKRPAEAVKLLAKDNSPESRWLRAAAYLLLKNEVEAEKLLKNFPAGKLSADLDVMRTSLRKEGAASAGKQRQLWDKVLNLLK